MDFNLALIQTITNNFSDQQKVGSGGYGDVYRAVYNGEEVVVKKLYPMPGIDDKHFNNEFRNLTKISHKNVVRSIDYCYESQHKYIQHNGELIFVKAMERVLCYEYVQGRSLEKYITDESCELDWPTCYDIIKGICEGINHLHTAQGRPILHLDLKPAKILLDQSMTPKIAGFGLSRFHCSTKTHKTDILKGTPGYMPPEYIQFGLITQKFDVYSLGVIIIKMMSGNTGLFSCSEMTPNEFIKLVTENWKKRLQEMSRFSSNEIDISQVRTCVEMALRCVDADRRKRPTIRDIIYELEIETIISPPPDYKSNWLVLDSQSRSTTATDQSKGLLEDEIKTNLIQDVIKPVSPPPDHKSNSTGHDSFSCYITAPDSRDLTEAEIKTNTIEAENKTIFSLPPDHNWPGLDSQSCSMAVPDQSKDLMLQMGPEPCLSFQYLQSITNNFCDERMLGEGGFAMVYKGVLQNGEMVAVKRALKDNPSSQKQFENEVNLLMKLKHPNIVQLVGYCYETQNLRIPHEGTYIFIWSTERLICLEYLRNGSLDKYISDASDGPDWHTRYKIIKGISSGLHYLHEQSSDPIIHLDMKPANILLAENMMPKITDFGLSRLFDQNQPIRTENIIGTRGYMPPEYVERGIITTMSDIFSLGVIIIQVITGHKDYPYDIKKSSERWIESELRKWRNVMKKKVECTSVEIDCQQIQRCLQIGLICVNPERTKRPTMKKIIEMLEGLESMKWYITNELSNDDIQEEL